MRQSTLSWLSATFTLVFAQSGPLPPNELVDESSAEACSPVDDDDAPCNRLNSTILQCGDRTLSLDEHHDCYCDGNSFATDADGCYACLLAEGAISDPGYNYLIDVVLAGHDDFCNSEPTASFGNVLDDYYATQTATSPSSSATNTGGFDDEIMRDCYPRGVAEAPCNRAEMIVRYCDQEELSLEDHQRCICDGSYQSDQQGCFDCLRVKGHFDNSSYDYFTRLISRTLDEFCGAEEPSASLEAVLSEYRTDTALRPTSTDTRVQTLVTGTAVSEYYTAPDEVGPGITHSLSGVSLSGLETETTTSTTTSGSATETPTDDDAGSEDEDDRAAPHLLGQGVLMALFVIAAGTAGFALI
jgi:hypothetical protein